MNSFTIVYVPTPTLEEAKKIAKDLLEKELIACANMIPVSSMYRWEGAIVEDGEVLLLMKTSQQLVDVVKKEVISQHSYSVPCVATLSAQANEPYYAWLCKQVQNP